jgi:hypothetical protein
LKRFVYSMLKIFHLLIYLDLIYLLFNSVLFDGLMLFLWPIPLIANEKPKNMIFLSGILELEYKSFRLSKCEGCPNIFYSRTEIEDRQNQDHIF